MLITDMKKRWTNCATITTLPQHCIDKQQFTDLIIYSSIKSFSVLTQNRSSSWLRMPWPKHLPTWLRYENGIHFREIILQINSSYITIIILIIIIIIIIIILIIAIIILLLSSLLYTGILTQFAITGS